MTEWNNETAEWYAEKFGEYPTNRLAVDTLDLQPDATILDIGCGTGSALRHAAEKVIQGSLIGIDPVPRMIEIAKEKTLSHPGAARITFQEGSAENIPLQNNSIDVIFAFDSVDHWKDLERGLLEIRRVLKSAGKFVIVKDLGVPGAKKKLKELAIILKTCSYNIISQQDIKSEGIKFTLMHCTTRKD